MHELKQQVGQYIGAHRREMTPRLIKFAPVRFARGRMPVKGTGYKVH